MLIVGGSIAIGLALNSKGVMAAELHEASTDFNVAEDNEENIVTQVLENMRECCESVEEDVVEAERYLEEAHDYINCGWMTADIAEEIKSESNSLAVKSSRNNYMVQDEYYQMQEGEAYTETEYYEQASNCSLDEFAKETQEAEDVQKKVEVINRAIDESKAKEKNDDFVAAANNYKNIVVAKAPAQDLASRSQAAYEKVVAVTTETINLINAHIATNTATHSTTINNMMRDIVGIEAGANTAEQNYKQAKELVDCTTLTADEEVQKIDNVSAALSKSQTAADRLQKKYDGVVAATDSAKLEFEKAAGNNGLTDYVTKCQETANSLEKIGVINNAMEAAGRNHATFVSEHADVAINDDTYNRIRELDGKIEYLEGERRLTEWNIGFYREKLESEPLAYQKNARMIEKFQNDKNGYIDQIEEAMAELESYKVDSYEFIVAETTNYHSFIAAANSYKDAIAVKSQADVVYERGQNGLAKAVLFSTQLTELIAAYDEAKAGAVSDDAKELDVEIANVEREILQAESAYKTADEKFNAFAAASEADREKYDMLAKSMAADPIKEKITQEQALIAEALEFMKRYEWDSPEYKQVMEEYKAKGGDYECLEDVITGASQRINDNRMTLFKVYGEPMSPISWEVDYYNELKAARDAAAQTLADNQKKLDDLNIKKAELDAATAEGYLNTAKEYIGNNMLTEKSYTEILDGSKAVYDQAKEKNDAIQAEYTTAVAEEAAAKEEYEKQLNDSNLEKITAEINKIEADYVAAKSFLSENENPEYKQDNFKAEENRILEEWNQAIADLQKQYEAGEMGEEEYSMCYAGVSDDYGMQLSGLHEYFDEYWEEKVQDAANTVNKYESLLASKAAEEEKLEPAKNKYEEKAAVAAQMQPIAARVQEAYDRTATAYTEIINLLNPQAENENPETPAEETALSQDVYTVFNKVKTIVMENPEILQKVYALYNNEKAVETVKYAYNYVVANVDISTINHYAKQLAGMDITPEFVNKYLDMFTNWINK